MIPPSQVGGPVLDVNGNFVGLNIARAGRIECYTLPCSIIEEALGDALPTIVSSLENRLQELREEERYFREELAELKALIAIDESIISAMLNLQQAVSSESDDVETLEVELQTLIERRTEFLDNPKKRGEKNPAPREKF